jgi:hypothetical protein
MYYVLDGGGDIEEFRTREDAIQHIEYAVNEYGADTDSIAVFESKLALEFTTTVKVEIV